MIVCHKYKFIFLKTKKVGGTSLEIALASHCGKKSIITPITPEDEEVRRQMGFPGAQNYRLPAREWSLGDWAEFARRGRIPPAFWNHMPADLVKRRLPRIWPRYFKFTVVRNPFEVVVSRFFWDRRNAGPEQRTKQAFREYLLDHIDVVRENLNIYQIDGRPAVDDVVRYENLAEDLARISERIGLPDNISGTMRGIRAKSSQRPRSGASAKEMFEGFEEGALLVSILARPEVERGNYILE